MIEIEDVMLRQKLLAGNINTVILFISLILLGLFLKITLLMAFIIYPMCSLLFYGVLKIRKGFTKELNQVSLKILNILFGIGCILFGLFFLIFIFSYPNIGFNQVINLLAFPVVVIGIAGIVKGIIIREYPYKYRIINIYTGIITIIIAAIAFTLTENYFIFHIISLPITILLNCIARAAMYLSEYKLTLRLRNLRIFFYIINEYSESEIFRRIILRRFKKNNSS